MTNIYLYGPPASGKTTLGKRLAESLHCDFSDLDAEIVARAGRSIPEIFAAEGEPVFRQLESDALREVSKDDGRIIALGGGTLLNESNRSLCEQTGAVLCLEAPDDAELERRIGAAAGSRPLGNRAAERAAHYASFPNRIAAFFEADRSLVVVGQGLAAPLLSGRRTVQDETVARLYESLLPSPIAVLPSGEVHKTPETVMRIWHALAEQGIGRKDLIVAVGGGVTGDLTGFAAATWMRGIDWINVPTTLLSMVDASTGGKTGCDLPEGKNLAGAFHQPRLVIIDTDFLKTLSSELIAAGRAEMIKHEIIGGHRAEVDLKSIPTAREIADNLMVKVGIVREDPFEKLGRRVLLNCGHTIAHAIEKLTNYKSSHGEAVAIGCVEEARLAVRLGLAPAKWPDELAARFASAGLPTELPEGVTWERMHPVMLQDKKRAGMTVEFALPCGWGDVRTHVIDFSKPEGV